MRAPVRTNPSLTSAGLDSAFDDGDDFAGTMTNIATSVGKSISGASSSISDGAMAVVRSSGNALAGITALLRNPKLLAGACGLIVVAVAAIWMMTGDSDDLSEPAFSQPQNAAVAPVTDETVDAATQETVAEIPQPLPVDFLQDARDARAAGNIVSPAGANAMEFYIAALNATPDDEAIAAELAELKEEAFGLAENALLDNRSTEAARALRVIGLADPESSRLRFLNVQFKQQQLRILLDQARVAMRESRFEDAGRLLTQAETVAVTDTSELDVLSEELATARGEAGNRALDDRSVSAPPAEVEREAEALAAAKRAEAERVAEQQAQDRQAEADRIAAEQAEADRVATEKAAAEQMETNRLAAEAAATKKADDDRIAAQQAAAEKAEADRIAAENAATEKAGADRIAAEQVATESAASAPETVSINAVKRILYVAPKFPHAAQRRNISGWVDLSFTVTTAGEVADVEIINAEPESIFIDSVTRAAEQWRFEPATENGQPVEKRIVMRLSFNLE